MYTINTYTVTFESEEDVELPQNLELEYNSVLKDELPKVPDLLGYTGEWQIGGKAVETDYKVTENMTVTAVYTINTYTVTFESDDPSIEGLPKTEILEHGWGLSNYLPEMPEKEGYTGRWTIDGEEIPDGYEVKSDITVKFEYVINTYEITFECDYNDVEMHDPITAVYGTPLSEALANYAVPEKPWYNGKWTVDGQSIANVTVKDNITVTAVYTHMKVSISVDYVGGYSDGGDNDPANFKLYTSEDGSLNYDITVEELQSKIDGWIDSVRKNNNYAADKVVYDNTDTSFDVLANPLDIDSLPEITSDTKFSDIVNDYVYDGVYCSYVRIYIVPAWENVYKVTFHDVDGKEIESHYSIGEPLSNAPTAPDGYTWIYYSQNQECLEYEPQQYSINTDTDVYCGYRVRTFEYTTEGSWDMNDSEVIPIGGSLTEDNFRRLTSVFDYSNGNYFSIAGFTKQPISGITDEAIELLTLSVGQTFDSNIDLYIVKASIEYTKLNGTTVTLYWSGEGSLVDYLNNLKTSENNVWKFEDGEEFNEENLNKRLYYDYDDPPDDPQTAARFTVVETAS